MKHTSHTIDGTGNDPDLEAFESNLPVITRARKLVKYAALVSNLCPNASDPHSVGAYSKDDAQLESHCCTQSNDLIASLIWIIHQMILKHPQNKSSKGVSTLLLGTSPH